MRSGTVLQFQGRTTSPFHSTRQPFSNLIKSAPYILGSTIRGALLKRLLERGLCPHTDELDAMADHDTAVLARLHRNQNKGICRLTPFFALPGESPQAYFSFGQFQAEPFTRYRAATRIALERANASVSEGAIVTIEAIQPDTFFSFEIVLFDDAQALAEELIRAAHETGRGEGWGRFRSIGYGQFVIEECQQIDFAERLEQARQFWDAVPRDSPIQVKFETPWVIRGDGPLPDFEPPALAAQLRTQLQTTLTAAAVEFELPLITSAEMSLKPEFISRFSYELGMRENRLVTLEGSGFSLSPAREGEGLFEGLAVASVLGMGEWSEWGFGRIGPRG